MRNMMLTKDGKWVEAKPIPFYYPRFIRMIPVKAIREKAEEWWWLHGERFEGW